MSPGLHSYAQAISYTMLWFKRHDDPQVPSGQAAEKSVRAPAAGWRPTKHQVGTAGAKWLRALPGDLHSNDPME